MDGLPTKMAGELLYDEFVRKRIGPSAKRWDDEFFLHKKCFHHAFTRPFLKNGVS